MLDHFASIIGGVYSPNAEIRTNPPNRIGVEWNLENDAERPNKKSKPIIIHFSDEFLADYPSHARRDGAMIERRILDRLQQHLSTFNPDHNAPLGTPVVGETIRIETDMFH